MSATRRTGNFENSGGRKVLNEVLTALTRAIAYWVAEEHRTEVLTLGADDQLVAAIDMVALMAEHYQISPEVNVQTVQQWRDICLGLFDRRSGFSSAEAASGWASERRATIVKVFAHLEEVAVAYPPFPPFDGAGEN